MPKNAVQRLQKIDKEIKTVLSIYDTANSSKENHGESETQKKREALHFSKISPSKCWETNLLLDKLQEQSPQSPSLLLDPFKQIGSFFPQPDQRPLPREPVLARKRYFTSRKPSSAPSSSSTLSTICESDYKWQQSSESITGVLGNPASLKTITSDGLNISEWIDSNSFAGECDRFMTPSKTLLTATEILTQSDYATDRKNGAEEKNLSGFAKPVPYGPGQVTASGETPEGENNVGAKDHPSHRSGERDSLLPVRTFGARMCRTVQKDKPLSALSPVPAVPKKISKFEKPDGPDMKTRTKFRSRGKELTEKQEKGWSPGKFECPKDDGWSDDGLRHASSKLSENHPGVKRERNPTAAQERRTNSPYERERRVQSPATLNSQKMQKSLEANEPGLEANQLSKILEKSNEKLEKMKMSKELALDIAKQLKNKYDEIQQSREGLMEKLQNVEKDNERLNNEVKHVQESKVKLQLKVEGLKSSKTKLQEEQLKAKELAEDNARLKAKITELEKQLSEKLLEKQNQIDQLQKERLSEIRNELIHRESRAEDVQRLTNEKAELIIKIEDLRSTLKDRQTAIESHERKIRQLEAEIQKQRQQLKKKTERLEDTHKELESIKKNSNDLENQVKTLRQNIENFDELHKNLMKQTLDYETEIRLKQEENQALKNDNLRLKSELENEKDALLIKTKIIEDHQETIRQLREKAEEAKTLLKRNQSLERVLGAERDEKLELQEAVERLKWRKEELKSRIKSLENDLLLAPQEVVRDLQKTQMVLHELENQVQIKQKEWELHLQALVREKEQACSVAEFATKKLMQTTTEFQKQSEAHKRLHRVLAENLAEKERHLREANEKVKTETIIIQNISKSLKDEREEGVSEVGDSETLSSNI